MRQVASTTMLLLSATTEQYDIYSVYVVYGLPSCFSSPFLLFPLPFLFSRGISSGLPGGAKGGG